MTIFYDSWYDFVEDFVFHIYDIKNITSPIYINTGETPIGGHSRPDLSGFKRESIMKVSPPWVPSNANDILILKFGDSLPLECGDEIRAYNPVADMEVKTMYPDDSDYEFKGRKLRKEERAFKIEKLGETGKVLATYEIDVTPEFFME